MTRITLDKKEEPEHSEKGATSLDEYIAALVKRN
jgi:hypothetical protein